MWKRNEVCQSFMLKVIANEIINDIYMFVGNQTSLNTCQLYFNIIQCIVSKKLKSHLRTEIWTRNLTFI